MADSKSVLKKKQTNFLISNFREFHKLWRDNQEAILKVKCCDGKLTINFESSFKVPESKPTLPTKVNEKVKRISPSRRRRNLARAELFRRNKASKDTADGFPATSKESQEESQEASKDTADGFPATPKESQEESQEAMIVSEASHESAPEKSPTSEVPVDKSTSIPETSTWVSIVQQDQSLKAPPTTEVAKRDKDAVDDKLKDGDNWEPVSNVKSKQSKLSLRIERFETEIRKDLAGKGPVKRGQSVTAREWLECCFSDLQQRISTGVNDSNLSDDLLHVQGFIRDLKKGIESGGPPNLFDEQEKRINGLFRSFYGLLQGHHRATPRGAPAHSVVNSYKHSPSAKFKKK